MPFPAARYAPVFVGASLMLVALLASGCIGARVIYPVMPTGEELRAFEAAGPADLQADVLTPASMQVAGPYRVGAGDLLSFELPPGVQAGEKASDGSAAPLSVAIKCRVKDDGTVLLPMLGSFAVVGKTPGEIEQDVALEYAKPTNLSGAPSVVVTISEFKTVNVVVIGAVNQPGQHELKSNQLSVVGALMAAGGIKSERGARQILVLGGTDEQGQPVTRTLEVMLDDIPLADQALLGGETIVVEPPPERSFTVYGLVKKSGIFTYPPPRRFNLMQALASAGGVDENAAPRYASIYRKRADGSIAGATFKIDGNSLESGSNIVIKDGDVIAVEHTQGSWLRQFFSQVFGFRASVNVSSTASPTL
ncbi:MAG: hypothetical protein EXS08_06330 [Planctomycetes bacterium]|nr:hypothetical protein [Planctomycetota bacterium]